MGADVRPFHGVAEIAEQRTTFALRQQQEPGLKDSLRLPSLASVVQPHAADLAFERKALACSTTGRICAASCRTDV
jgi:hypothetical protein